MKKKYNKGFTLIELLVVIAIIGILATIAISSFRGARIKAKETAFMKRAESIQLALELYYTDHGHYPGDSTWTHTPIYQGKPYWYAWGQGCSEGFNLSNDHPGELDWENDLVDDLASYLPEGTLDLDEDNEECMIYYNNAHWNHHDNICDVTDDEEYPDYTLVFYTKETFFKTLPRWVELNNHPTYKYAYCLSLIKK